MMDQAVYDLLRSVDTPTICNAIEMAQGKRGFDRFTRGTMLCSAPTEPAMLGYARTAKIAAAEPPSDTPDIVRERRMAYYRYMSEGPRPAVAVVQDLDVPKALGAYWGEINTTVHKSFGLGGALTNGVMRDLGDLPEGFPVVAGSVGPSHGYVHVREIDTEVRVFGLTVAPGELVHADRHGALVIPDDIIPDMPATIGKLLQTERLILEPARAQGFDFAAFEQAWSAFEKARI